MDFLDVVLLRKSDDDWLVNVHDCDWEILFDFLNKCKMKRIKIYLQWKLSKPPKSNVKHKNH